MVNDFDLPDFNDMTSIIDKIKILGYKKIILENKIKSKEAIIVKDALTKKEHYPNDKIPSMAFITSTYLFTGFNGELLPLREELAQVISDLEHSKLTFRVYEDMIEVWRTQSANERRSVN